MTKAIEKLIYQYLQNFLTTGKPLFEEVGFEDLKLTRWKYLNWLSSQLMKG